MQHIADKVPAQAWKDIEAASIDRDISDFKEAVLVLIKACPEMTYPQLEKEFRKRRLNVYLIALVSPAPFQPHERNRVTLSITLMLTNVFSHHRRRTTGTLSLLSTYKVNLERNTLCRTF